MSDMIRFSCSVCGKRLKVPPKLVGRRVRCGCGQSQFVPELLPLQDKDDAFAAESPEPRSKSRKFVYVLAGLGLLVVVSVGGLFAFQGEDRPTELTPAPSAKADSSRGSAAEPAPLSVPELLRRGGKFWSSPAEYRYRSPRELGFPDGRIVTQSGGTVLAVWPEEDRAYTPNLINYIRMRWRLPDGHKLPMTGSPPTGNLLFYVADGLVSQFRVIELKGGPSEGTFEFNENFKGASGVEALFSIGIGGDAKAKENSNLIVFRLTKSSYVENRYRLAEGTGHLQRYGIDKEGNTRLSFTEANAEVGNLRFAEPCAVTILKKDKTVLAEKAGVTAKDLNENIWVSESVQLDGKPVFAFFRK